MTMTEETECGHSHRPEEWVLHGEEGWVKGISASNVLSEMAGVGVYHKRGAPEFEVRQRRLTKRRILPARTDAEMARLEEAASKGNETAFLNGLNEIQWKDRPASDFVRAIKLALRAGAFGAARHLAAEGAKHHHEDSDIQKYARVLSPTNGTKQTEKVSVNTGTNRKWLEEHAGQYPGLWVALRNGELLGVAESLKTLVEEVSRRHGVTFPSKEVMVTTGY